MPWSWQLPDWPKFTFDAQSIIQQERQLLLGMGSTHAFLNQISNEEHNQFLVEMLSQEGVESSKIEGENLDRESLQSSIRQQFGLQPTVQRNTIKEAAMAKLLCAVYYTFDQPLTHEMLWHWHSLLFESETKIDDVGRYRTHEESMQIVSNRYDRQKVFFEAPPSARMLEEMTRYIDWFNDQSLQLPILGRAAIAHVYFESIHPFEDGNGRIGRALIEKVLSQAFLRPVLLAVSKVLEHRRKEYYAALEQCNRTLDVGHWVLFFSDAVLKAQKESIELLRFLIKKSSMLTALSGKINSRQEKVLLRMFAEGPKGFEGGLSAEKYLSITKTSRATATRDLTDLVQKGCLVQTGQLRHTRYWLNLE